MRNYQSNYTLVILCVIVITIISYPWLDARRGPNSSQNAETQFIVVSSLDNGPGSLRAALFEGLRANGPYSIVLRADNIRIKTPLPPLVSKHGIKIFSEERRSTIDASELRNSPVFDLRSGEINMDNIAIRSAPGEAIRVTDGGQLYANRIEVTGSDVGIYAMGSYELSITDSDFIANRVGVRIYGSNAGIISNATFLEQKEANIWVIGFTDKHEDNTSLILSGSRLEGARYGIVLGNAAVQLQNNLISDFSSDGILALGGIVYIKDNKIWNGKGAAIRSVGLLSANIANNEVHENVNIGMILQSGSSTRVEGNYLYRNGYGIVTVTNKRPAAVSVENNLVLAHKVDGIVAIGDSPSITDNTVFANYVAGIRVLRLILPSRIIPSSPVIARNILENNGLNNPVFSEYHSNYEISKR